MEKKDRPSDEFSILRELKRRNKKHSDGIVLLIREYPFEFTLHIDGTVCLGVDSIPSENEDEVWVKRSAGKAEKVSKEYLSKEMQEKARKAFENYAEKLMLFKHLFK